MVTTLKYTFIHPIDIRVQYTLSLLQKERTSNIAQSYGANGK